MRISKFESRIKHPNELLALVRYDRGEGALYWLPRDPSQFGGSSHLANIFNAKYSHKRCGSLGIGGYRYINGGNGEFFYEHRAIVFIENGVWPEEVDHIDGNRANNKFTNLRDVGRIENSQNTGLSVSNKSGHTGVFLHRKSGIWEAKITVNYRPITLYRGRDKEAAIAARKVGEIKYGFHPNHGRKRNASG